MLGAKAAVVVDRRRGNVCGVRLCSSDRAIRKPGVPSVPSLSQYMGQRYTRLEPEARCIEFRRIHRDDRDLFVLSVTDNLVNV